MKTVVCADCGLTIQVETLKRKLCDDCRVERRRAKDRERSKVRYYAGLSQSAPCAGPCGGIVRIGGRSRRVGEAMCQECRKAATIARHETVCAAPGCGKTFSAPSTVSKSRPRKYCSHPCANSVNGPIMRAANPQPRLDPAEALARKRLREFRKRSSRRAVERETKVEPVSPLVVFERDGWRCHICGKKCRTDVNGLHPQGATMDHLIPLSKGGPHTYANIATAHKSCNSRKGNRAANDQLALI